MSEFAHEMARRVSRTIASLHEARAAGDDYLVEVRLGELESLGRLARDHDLDLPEVAAELSASGPAADVQLADGDPCPTAPVQTALAPTSPDAPALHPA